MKLAKYMLVVALFAVPFASQLHGQTLQGVVAGASSLFLEAGQGTANNLGCVWTDTTGTNSYVTDSRVGVNDAGKLWVAWSTGTGGTCAAPVAGSVVYAYISLDSGIGNRCLFAEPQCTLNTTDAAGTTGGNGLAGFTDTALPSGVLSAFNGASINIAATDITPLDALFATYQALAPCGYLSSGTQYQGYGRGGWPGPGTQFQSSFSSAIFNVIGWQITGTDPFSGLTAAGGYTITPVGATPVLVFVNTSNASGFGSASITNVDRATLGLMEGNILVRTADLIPQAYNPSGTYYGVTVLHRESLSGTYNVFDRAIPNNKEIYRVQEQQCPPVEPMDITRTVGGTTGTQKRVIGTGQMVSEVFAVQDSIGYAFWSAANFKSATYGAGTASTSKYLTVDGVDPLFAAYSTTNPGEIPTSGNGLLPSVTLQHIQDGSYPIWSELRLVTTNSTATGYASTLSGWAQSYSSIGGNQPDFITAPNLNVIHSHFSLPFVTDAYTAAEGSRVCGASGAPEAGGDAGGLVTTLQAGSDYAVLKGNYNTASCVGITNAASFGVHQ